MKVTKVSAKASDPKKIQSATLVKIIVVARRVPPKAQDNVLCSFDILERILSHSTVSERTRHFLSDASSLTDTRGRPGTRIWVKIMPKCAKSAISLCTSFHCYQGLILVQQLRRDGATGRFFARESAKSDKQLWSDQKLAI